MKKLFIIFLILLLTGSAIAEWPYHNKPWLGKQIDWSHPLANGLVFFMLGNEGSGNKVFDLSGNGNDGTLNGTALTWTSGKFGSALDFPGTNEYINIPSSSTLEMGTSSFSVVFWTNPSDESGVAGFVTKREASTGIEKGWGINTQAGSNQGQIYIGDGTSGVDDTSIAVGPLYDGSWHQVVVVFDKNGVASWYTDGILRDTTASITSIGDISLTSQAVVIGAFNNGGSLWLDAIIDNVSIYNHILTTSEIDLLYREPFCMFEDSPIVKMFTYPAVGVVPTSYYYIGFLLLPFLPFSVILALYTICFIRGDKKCAA